MGKRTLSPRKMSVKEFAPIAELVQDWMTIEDIVDLCDEHNFWPPEFLEGAVRQLKKVAVRNLARQIKFDTQGNPIELVSLIQRNEKTGKEERAYKQQHLFVLDDYVQVIADRWRRRNYFDSEIRRFVHLVSEQHGPEGARQVRQMSLPLGIPEDFFHDVK
jgi:hypothetical protein